MSRVQVRVGTDIVPVARIARLAERGDAFLHKWFTDAELAHCHARAHPEQHLASRFAAKEAVFKAVGGDSAGPAPWHDIEILSAPGGAPGVRLAGAIAAAAAEQGLGSIQVSLSHCEDYATATAVALVDEDP